MALVPPPTSPTSSVKWFKQVDARLAALEADDVANKAAIAALQSAVAKLNAEVFPPAPPLPPVSPPPAPPPPVSPPGAQNVIMVPGPSPSTMSETFTGIVGANNLLVFWGADVTWYQFVDNKDGTYTATETHASGQVVKFSGIQSVSFGGVLTPTVAVTSLPFSGGPSPPPPPPLPQVTTIPPRPTTPVIGALVAPMTATVDFGNGTVWQFNEQQAIDLGDYVDPQFTQHCHAHSPVSIPMTVYFRPDMGGVRNEVVFEVGWQSGFTPVNLGAYTATIRQSGVILATVSVPKHDWDTRWRWQSAPRPLRRTPAQIFAAGEMLPLDATLALGVTPSTAAVAYTPMCFTEVGLTAYMGSTGERDDIGLVTESIGEWLCTGSATAYARMLAQAEAHATVPVHFRDETMGTLSIARYPAASCYSQQLGDAGPWFPTVSGATVSPDSAHYPALSYIPFLATGDPYFLEEQQFAATFALICNGDPGYRQFAKGIFSNMQIRGFAWSLRMLAQAEKISPVSPPLWLAPKSYWTTLLANNRDWFTSKTSGSPSALVRNCNAFLADTFTGPGTSAVPSGFPPWQEDFVAIVTAWMANAGYADWAAAGDWTAGQAVGRTVGTNGYPRSRAIQYYYPTDDGASDWLSLASVNALTETADGQFPPGFTNDYAAYLQGVLATAERRGLTNAAACYAYVRPQCVGINWTPWKWAFRAS